MAIVVEDGTGLADANSYISTDYLIAYAIDTGQTDALSGGDPAAAAIRATTWIEGNFRSQFPGTPVNGRDQALHFPAEDGIDANGYDIPSDEVPVEVQKATAEAALRELASAGSLSPDQAVGSSVVKREKVGSLEVEYAVADGGIPAAPWFPTIAGILAPLIGGTSPMQAAWIWR